MPLEFEKASLELEQRIEELREYAQNKNINMQDEIAMLERKLETMRSESFDSLTRWQRVQLARAPGRPTSMDYVQTIFTEFEELHGDRAYGDDAAIVTGLAKLGTQSVVIAAQQKGRDTKENIQRNFGMAHPEGFRKCMRMMDMADKFKLPFLTFIDTPGAYPGVAAEERGQAWLIAQSIQRMSRLRVPAIAVIVGEGGSGGALALGVGNRVLIMENAVYSVISPESCAAILWRDAKEAEKAAEALKLCARDLEPFGIVDEVIAEPNGGAHNDNEGAAKNLKMVLEKHLQELLALGNDTLMADRAARFRKLGVFANV